MPHSAAVRAPFTVLPARWQLQATPSIHVHSHAPDLPIGRRLQRDGSRRIPATVPGKYEEHMEVQDGVSTAIGVDKPTFERHPDIGER